jgi:hypothetical protein
MNDILAYTLVSAFMLASVLLVAAMLTGFHP